METIFPINYFMTIFSPIKSFLHRQYLRWWQMGLIILLLNGLMLMPLAFQLGNLQSASLTDFVPTAMAAIDDEFVEKYNQQLNNGVLIVADNQFDTDKQTGFALSLAEANTLLNHQTGVILTPDGFIVRETGRPSIEQQWVSMQPLEAVANSEQLIAQLSRHWFTTNRLAIVMTNFINVWLLFLISFLALLLGTSFLLWLTRFSRLFTIDTFNQALHISLNVYGLATIVAMVIGFFTADPNTMMLVQSTVYIFYLLWIYWKTHFNDQYIAEHRTQ